MVVVVVVVVVMVVVAVVTVVMVTVGKDISGGRASANEGEGRIQMKEGREDANEGRWRKESGIRKVE